MIPGDATTDTAPSVPIHPKTLKDQMPDVQPGSGPDMASNIQDILRGAPLLKQAPGLTLALARKGANVVDNAQGVAGVAKLRANDIAKARFAGDQMGSDAAAAFDQPEVQTDGGTLGSSATGIAVDTNAMGRKGSVSTTGRTLSAPGGDSPFTDAVGKAADFIGLPGAAHDVASAVTGLPGAVEGIPGDIKRAIPKNFGQPTPEAATAMSHGSLTGVLMAGGSSLAGQAGQIVTTPQHLIRYWTDVEERHGPAALIEAIGPSLAAGAATALITHNPEATEGAATAAGDLITGETEGAAAAAPAETVPEVAKTSAQKLGQVLRTGISTAAKPVTVPAGAIGKGVTALATSPTALAGETAGMGTAQELFKDSWARTASSSYLTPKGHLPVSFGRLVADALGTVGVHHGTALYNGISGALDGLFDVSVPDPIGALGRASTLIKEGEGGRLLGRSFGGTVAKTPQDVERIVQQYASKRNALELMPELDAGQIARMWPQYAPLSPRLGAASTFDEVKDVFKDAARTQELLTTSDMPGLTSYSKTKSLLRGATAIETPAPTVLDTDLANFSNHQFKIGDPHAIPSIQNFFKASGENERVVSDLGTVLAGTTDPRLWRTALQNATKLSLGRMTMKYLHGSPDLTQAVIDAIDSRSDELWGGRGAGFTGQMGLDENGADLSRVWTNDPTDNQSRVAALWMNQASTGVFPNLHDFPKAARDLAAMEDWTIKNGVYTKGAAFRDFVNEWVNNKFFKPLALATGGWAVRVSSSEAVLNVLRHGPVNYSAARIAASLAKQDFHLSNDAEMGHFVAAIRGVLAGTEASALKGIGRDKFLDAATALVYLHDGHIVAPGADATHALPLKSSDEPERQVADIGANAHQFKTKRVALSNNFSILSPGQSGYFRSWAEYAGRISSDEVFGKPVAEAYKASIDAGLSKEGASALAVHRARAILDSGRESRVGDMERHTAMSLGSTVEPHQDWATQAVKALKGTVYGPDGTFHRDMLDDIANGTVPDLNGTIAKYGKTDPGSLPNVPGRQVELKTSDILRRLAASAHTRVLGPVVNHLSREPTFVLDFAKERQLLAKKVSLGEMTQDQADVIAQTRAVSKTIRFVHNPQDRTKVENMLSLVSPFYFAQNQAIRRAGRLFAANPGAFEQYLKLMLQVQNVSYQVTQKNGQSSFIIPGSTISGEGITNFLGHVGIFPTGSIPIGLSGSVDSMQTIFPWSGNGQLPGSPQSALSALRPSVGPVAAIPLKEVQNLFAARAPALSKAAADALGPVGASTAFWTQAIPNSIIEHLVQGAAGYFGGPQQIASSYNSALLGVMASMADNGQLPPSDNPKSQAAFIQKARNLTGILWLARTLVSGVSPVSVSLGQANLKFSDEVQSEINSHNGNVLAGIDAFIAKNPSAYPSTVYKSTSDTGAAFPETAKAGAWMQSHASLINTYPYASRYLLPVQDAKGKFNDGTYQLEVAEGLRHVDTPQQFLNQIYISAGNYFYGSQVKPLIDKALAQNASNATNIYDARDKVLAEYGSQNPIWYNNWNAYSSHTNRLVAVRQMREMLADPQTPKTEQSQHLHDLLDLYDKYQGLKTDHTATNAELKARWGATMTAAAKAYPDVAPAITDVFTGLG